MRSQPWETIRPGKLFLLLLHHISRRASQDASPDQMPVISFDWKHGRISLCSELQQIQSEGQFLVTLHGAGNFEKFGILVFWICTLNEQGDQTKWNLHWIWLVKIDLLVYRIYHLGILYIRFPCSVSIYLGSKCGVLETFFLSNYIFIYLFWKEKEKSTETFLRSFQWGKP